MCTGGAAFSKHGYCTHGCIDQCQWGSLCAVDSMMHVCMICVGLVSCESLATVMMQACKHRDTPCPALPCPACLSTPPPPAHTRTQTSVDGVYAIGDVASFPLLAAGGALVRQEHVTHARSSAAQAAHAILGEYHSGVTCAWFHSP